MKSERAKQYLLKVVAPIAIMYPDCPEECDLKLIEAKRAVELAEQEAEERMRQKAISAFDAMWFGDGDNKCDTCESGNCDDCECCASEFEPDYEYHRKNFIQKLNEE